jgi:catechol 2,3-dioxygenase-like lactoylglutathione lyase family enzyme
MRLDGVRLSVREPAAAVAAYERLLDATATVVEDGRWRFQLGRGAIEIVAGEGAASRAAVTFAAEDGDDLATWPTDSDDLGGLDVLLLVPPPSASISRGVAGIDHVVVHTGDPERAIAQWRDRLGLRLALDRTFPERKLRLLFFRSGGLTLEYAHALDNVEDVGDDAVYGVSYRVADVAQARGRLLAAGLDVSDVRPGMKAGSRVVTVRSGTAGVPTLLIEQPPRA